MVPVTFSQEALAEAEREVVDDLALPIGEQFLIVPGLGEEAVVGHRSHKTYTTYFGSSASSRLGLGLGAEAPETPALGAKWQGVEEPQGPTSVLVLEHRA